MADEGAVQIETLLMGAKVGNAQAASDLLPLVYDELKALARRKMGGERNDHTLQPTALVHEAYARLVGGTEIPWEGQTHFFFAAAEAMRRILIDHARGRAQLKRGGGRKRVPLTGLDVPAERQLPQILALDEALSRLEQTSPDVTKVVKLRFYGGLSVDETAKSLGVSPRTVKRDWTFARAWLNRELRDDSR